MANTTQYRGKILVSLYSSKSGKTAKSMPLKDQFASELLQKIQDAGDGAVIRMKHTSPAYKEKQNERLKEQKKQGTPADYFLEILTAQEIAEERAELEAQKEDI